MVSKRPQPLDLPAVDGNVNPDAIAAKTYVALARRAHDLGAFDERDQLLDDFDTALRRAIGPLLPEVR